MAELLNKAFESDLTEAEEQLFDMLESEWLARQRNCEIDNWDYWTIPKGE